MDSFEVVRDGEIIRILIMLISNDAIDVTKNMIVIISLNILVSAFCFEKKSSLPLVRKQERRACLFAFMTKAALIVCRRIFHPTVFRYRRVFDFDFDGVYVVTARIPAVSE